MTTLATAPWWANETVLALHEVPQHLPPRSGGNRTSTSTIYRYTTVGICGVRLRRFRASGAGWATTLEELHRWQAAISAIRGEVD